MIGSTITEYGVPPTANVSLLPAHSTVFPGEVLQIAIDGNQIDRAMSLSLVLVGENAETILKHPIESNIFDVSFRSNIPIGRYSLCILQSNWCLDRVPFAITSKQVAQATRTLLQATFAHARAFELLELPDPEIDQVMSFAESAEMYYSEVDESALARATWNELAARLSDLDFKVQAEHAQERAASLAVTEPTIGMQVGASDDVVAVVSGSAGRARMKVGAAIAKNAVLEVKEIKFRPGTDESDYAINMRNLRRYIEEDGDRNKVTLRFRGREITHQDIGMRLLERIRDELADVSNVERRPKSKGGQVTMVLTPKRK